MFTMTRINKVATKVLLPKNKWVSILAPSSGNLLNLTTKVTTTKWLKDNSSNYKCPNLVVKALMADR